jgi:hypothetical protein
MSAVMTVTRFDGGLIFEIYACSNRKEIIKTRMLAAGKIKDKLNLNETPIKFQPGNESSFKLTHFSPCESHIQ